MRHQSVTRSARMSVSAGHPARIGGGRAKAEPGWSSCGLQNESRAASIFIFLCLPHRVQDDVLNDGHANPGHLHHPHQWAPVDVNGNLAYEIGQEAGGSKFKNGTESKIDWILTNVYEKIDGRWESSPITYSRSRNNRELGTTVLDRLRLADAKRGLPAWVSDRSAGRR